MAEFWEANFQDKQMMWGEASSLSALFAQNYFLQQGIKNVLIPGIGYGRNAKPFLDAGMSVTGIEISQTAINLAKQKIGMGITIYHGSVSDMPFDDLSYDGIFCHALIHLLDESQRSKLVKDCNSQLAPGGTMIFTAVSTKSPAFGQGRQTGPQRFEQHGGVQIFFYDEESLRNEFNDCGLLEVREITEPSGKDRNIEIPFLMAISKKIQ